MSENDQPSEQELRAAYEAELKKIRVEHVLLEQVVTLVNLGMRKTGIAPGTEDERDGDQVRMAIEGVRAVMPLLEQSAPEQLQQIREALSQLQLAYVRLGAGDELVTPSGAAESESGSTPASPGSGSQPPPPGPSSPDPDPSESGEPGPAQRSGRLWVPGQ